MPYCFWLPSHWQQVLLHRAPTPSLPAVEDALVKGRSVAVSLDLGRCTSSSGDEKPSKTRGGLKIEAFRIMDDGTLAFADEHMTLDLEESPSSSFCDTGSTRIKMPNSR